MTIKSMPTTQKYRDNYDRIFQQNPGRAAPCGCPIRKGADPKDRCRQAPKEKFPTTI